MSILARLTFILDRTHKQRRRWSLLEVCSERRCPCSGVRRSGSSALPRKVYAAAGARGLASRDRGAIVADCVAP